MSAVVEARDLGRTFGLVVGVNDLTLSIEGGAVGLIGPNGAGKSTFLKLVVGEIRPTRGDVRVLGERPFANRRLYRRLGFSPQQDALYDGMTALGMVRFLLRLQGFGRAEARARALRALERVHLGDALERRVGGFSKGMRQRVKIAQAIAHDPDLVVLDEPLNGLDPIGRRGVLGLLRELAAGGTHVVLSSHVLHEVAELTEEIVLIHRGRLLAQGAVGEVRALLTRFPRWVDVQARDARRLAEGIVGWPEVRAVRVDDEAGRLSVETRDVDAFHRRLTVLGGAGGFGLRGVEAVDAGLEAVFDYLVE